MPDLILIGGSFQSTSASVVAQTEKGKEFLASMFGTGAVSVALPKSKAIDLAIFAERKGLSTQ